MNYSDEWLTILGGDCREVLRTLPASSVHCVITSPPYWGLRDYGTASWTGGDEGCDHALPRRRTYTPDDAKEAVVPSVRPGDPGNTLCGQCGARRTDGQLGLEAAPEEYVATMVDVFREVRRVLRDDGTLWLNLGDSYRSTSGHNYPQTETYEHGHNRYKEWETTPDFGRVKPKDLVGIPWRVAFALQADGWYLRSDIIWSKPNPMPESVTDRPTKSHEYLFLLSKSPRYYFDADAVAERRDPSQIEWRERYAETINRWGERHEGAMGRGGNGGLQMQPNGPTRNIRSVWTIATAPYPGAHFATFPPKLVEPCVKAGTSERGVCPECGAPWERVVERDKHPDRDMEAQRAYAAQTTGRTDGRVPGPSGMVDVTRTTGWRPTCKHYPRTSEWREYPPRKQGETVEEYEERTAPIRALRTELLALWEPMTSIPSVMLDPFAGTGTVGMVAQSLSRKAVLIDLNPDYLRQCLSRNAQTPLGI